MSWLYSFIRILFWALDLAILARVILSWIHPNPDSRLVQIVWEITEPIMRPLRRIVPPLGTLDITPMIALFVLEMLQRFLLTALQRLGI